MGIFEDELAKVNRRLKDGRMGIAIRVHGKKLIFRGTFPPKPDTPRVAPKQYDLSLGYTANLAGLRAADIKAREIGAKLSAKTFDWYDYLKVKPKTGTVGEWIEELEKKYFMQKSRQGRALSTWKRNYMAQLRRLDVEQDLTPEYIIGVLEDIPPDTPTARNKALQVFDTLLSCAGYALTDAQKQTLRVPYGRKQLKPRDLPTDAEIEAMRLSIPKDSYRWVFGVIAAYGLRPHEVFYIDPESIKRAPGAIVLLDERVGLDEPPKTGGRQVWPFHPRWWEEWRLAEMQLPPVTGDNNSDLGNKIGHRLRQYGIPKLYNLRHRWCVRTIELGLPSELAAKQQGHSVALHNELYHYWIDANVHQRAFDAIVERLKGD